MTALTPAQLAAIVQTEHEYPVERLRLTPTADAITGWVQMVPRGAWSEVAWGPTGRHDTNPWLHLDRTPLTEALPTA